MKRADLIRHLERFGCGFFREGGNHTVYVNRSAGKSSSIPILFRAGACRQSSENVVF